MKTIEQIRVSLGTAIELGLIEGRAEAKPTTAFLMTYSSGKCTANCAFCPQAQGSESNLDRLSRIAWPEYPIDDVIDALKDAEGFSRVCLQCLNYPDVVLDVVEIIKSVGQVFRGPISTCIHPIPIDDMTIIHDAGVTSIGIALDACNHVLFENIKGKGRHTSYTWDSHIESLKNALAVFGKGNVTTHLIIGMGETEYQAAETILRMYELGVTVGLFAFTPVKGTDMENTPPPELGTYRRLQIVRHLASKGLLTRDQLAESPEGLINIVCSEDELKQALSSGVAFETSGCSGCNRPYYNETPRGPMFNYPRPLTNKEAQKAIVDSGIVCD